jgi:hypothetical protein
VHDVECAIVLLVDIGLVLKKEQVGQEPRYGMNAVAVALSHTEGI